MDVAELRTAFERITSKRGDVTDLRVAFDAMTSRREAEANGSHRTRSASPRLHSSPFHVCEASPCLHSSPFHVCEAGRSTPERWPSPRPGWHGACTSDASVLPGCEIGSSTA
jgi:hypothetical protein